MSLCHVGVFGSGFGWLTEGLCRSGHLLAGVDDVRHLIT